MGYRPQRRSGQRTERNMDRIRRLWQFFLDSWRELRFNVTWPSRKEVGGSTIVVLFMVGVMAVFLFLVDSVLHVSVQEIVRYFAGAD